MDAEELPKFTVYLGTIVTMEESRPQAEALVVRGDRIVYVGDRDGAFASAGANPRVVELGDHALLPGLIDSHSHLGLVALYARFVNVGSPPVGPASSIEDMVQILRAAPNDPETGDWILGANYDHSQLAEQRHPTREDLDRVSSTQPVAVVHFSQHMGVLNSVALARWGVSADTPDPDGGRIHRRSGSREPNGLLEEGAWIPHVAEKLPIPSVDQLVANMSLAQATYAANGYTTAQDGLTIPPLLAALNSAASAGELELDVVAYPPWQTAEDVLQAQPPSGGYDGGMRIGGVKVILDGGLPGKTAWLSEPYTTPPPGQPDSYCAYPQLKAEELVDALTRYHEKGRQILVHALGDAACEQMIDAVAQCRDDGVGDDRDFIMVHATTVRTDQLDRMRELGIMPSFFASHNHLWGDFHRQDVLGPERAAKINPCQSATQRGMAFTVHNDSPVVPPLSMLLLWSTVARTTRSGHTLGPEERVSIWQGLRALTIDAAYQYREEDDKGSLKEGKLADLVILSANPLRVEPQQLKDLKIITTISHGRQIHPKP